MSDTSDNLLSLFLRSLAIPLGLFTVWSAAERVLGSHRWVALAVVAGVFLLLIVGTLGFYAGRFLLRSYLRRTPEMEFGVEPPVCAHCGYDLRASPDHCPECGRPVDPLDRTIIQYLTRLRRKP